MTNKEISLNIIKKRWRLSTQDKIHFDHIIYDKTIQLINVLSTNRYIMVYWPTENEVETIAIIDELLKSKKLVCIPYITEEREVILKKITSVNFEYEWYKNYKMPKNGQIIPIENVRIFILPVVAYNNDNYYINYSDNSVFDQLLIKSNNILKIGLAYDFQKSNEFKIHDHFLYHLDKIITN